MASVTLRQVSKTYPNGFTAIAGLDLEVADGEFVILVGPSGCGKSTALRLVAGLEEVSGGEVQIGERVVNDIHPRARDIAMVFQNYALYPHMTVAQNIGVALKLAKLPRPQIAEDVARAARMLDLTDHLDRKPAQLSGGQRQRVAMGRAIVRHPKVFLMDEPLSNLDAKLRVQMRAEIAELQRELAVTTIYVTHDQIEAMTMGDRVAVLDAGVLQQFDTPQSLYDHPDNLFVAGFMGSPAMNLMRGRLTGSADGPRLQLGSHELYLPTATLAARPGLARYMGRDLAFGIRPEHVGEAIDSPHPGTELRGQVSLVESLGSEVLLHFKIDVPPVVVLAEDEGTPSAKRSDEAGLATYTARFRTSSRPRGGRELALRFDTDHCHLFDLESGLAIRN